jgi:nucleoside-diphosphate-sugar epimerase
MAKLILSQSFIPIVGEGKTRWNNVHISDLADLYCLLVEKAVAKDLNDEIWGLKGYMLAENGEHVWSDLARLMAKEAVKLGYISDPKEASLSKDKALEAAGFEAVSWGLNSRGKAERAGKFLGWKPTRPSLEEEVPNILKEEHERLKKA